MIFIEESPGNPKRKEYKSALWYDVTVQGEDYRK